MRKILILIAVLPIAAGCAAQSEVKRLKDQVASAEREVKALREDLKKAQMEIVNLQWQDSLSTFNEIAYLTPGGEGYSVVQCDLGRMTVSLENIEPYANGSRVSLRFGNLTSATINGAQAKIEWGSVDEKGTPKNDAAHNREVKFVKNLRAGAWTTVPVVLEGVPPTALGFVRVRDVTHTGISLLK